MRIGSRLIPRSRQRFATLALALLAAPIMLLASSLLPPQDVPTIIGRIEGSEVVVKTATDGKMETDTGQTAVANGSDVTVGEGHALLLLDGGGEIGICGPAHFTMHKSTGALMLALDYGRVRPSLDVPDTLTIYTPTIIATPVSIGGAQRNATVGLDQNGDMCILTDRGAVRVEQQLSGQSVLLPQGGTISLVGGQIESLRANASSCSCEFSRASVETKRPAPTSPQEPSSPPEISALSHPAEPEPNKSDSIPPAAPPSEEPVYTVLMPALSFNANSPAPPPSPSSETILLLREVRVRPTAVFRGHVDPAPVLAAGLPATAAPPPVAQAQPAATQPKSGFMARVRNFFRSMSGKAPCEGAGCSN